MLYVSIYLYLYICIYIYICKYLFIYLFIYIPALVSESVDHVDLARKNSIRSKSLSHQGILARAVTNIDDNDGMTIGLILMIASEEFRSTVQCW